MFKKIVSLILVMGITAGSSAFASLGSGAAMDDISGNLIKYGAFDLQSDVDGMLSDDGSWTSSKNFKYELNTNPANTYAGSWGSLKVTQNLANEQSERFAGVTLRRNMWYHLTGAVKLAAEHKGDTTFGIVLANADSWDKWTWNWNVLGSSEFGNTVNTNLGTVKLSQDDWYKIDVYFQPCLTADQISAAGSFEYGFTDANLYYDPYSIIFRVGNENQPASYYLDELSLTAVDGGVNPYFENNAKGWSWNGYIDPQIVSFDAEQEGVSELVKSGDFPNVKTVRKIVGNAAVGAALPFEQTAAMQNKKSYEISMWVKGETTDKDSSYSSEYCKFIPFWFNAGANNVFSWYYGTNWVQSGVTYARKGEWTHIKFIVYNDISSLDGHLMLRYNANASTEINSDEASTAGSTFYIANVDIKEASDNLISNPHFVKMDVWNDWTPKNPRSCDDPHYNSGIANTNGWTHNAGFTGKTNVENKTFVPDVTFDGSKAWGEFDLSADGSDYVGQTVNIDSSRKYNLSAWVKTQQQGSFAFVIGDDVVKANTVAEVKGWSKLGAAAVIPTVSGEQPVGITMIDENKSFLNEGSFLFTDFTVCEAKESVGINDITIGGLTKENAMTVTVNSDSALEYAGLYRYTVGEKTVKSGRINAGEEIPPLEYSDDYLGLDIKLIFKPLSIYNIWGEDAVSNSYFIPTQTVDARASLLSVENSDGDIIADIDGESDIDLSEASDAVGSVEISSEKAPAKATLLLAAYDASGRIVSVVKASASVPANTVNQRIVTAPIMLTDNIASVKAFVWNDDIKPLSSAVTAAK